MSSTRRRFSQGFKDGREIIDSSKPVNAVAVGYGGGAETLRSWLKKYKQEHGVDLEPEPTVTERARLNELERGNQEMRAKADAIWHSDRDRV